MRRSQRVSRFRPGEFNGRQLLMLELTSTLERAKAGAGAMVLLTGEVGIGKTAVAEELGRTALRQNLAVLWGSCVAGGGQPPYWPFRQILRQCGWARIAQSPDAGQLTALLPEHGQFVGTDRIRLFEAITRLLTALAAEQPMLIVLDDLPLADPASLAYLDFLGHRVTSAGIMIVATGTDRKGAPASASRLELDRLTAWETKVALSTSMDGWPDPELTEKIWQRGGGLPLFTVEAARGLPPVDLPASEVVIPDDVTTLVQRRISSMGIRTAQILSEAAVLGVDFDAREVAKVSGRRLDHIRAALADAARAVLIAERPGDPYRFSFMHPLIRDLAAARLSTSDRMALHGQAGQMLAENWFDHAGEASSWIAEHFYLGPSPKRAAEYARRAGDYATAVLAPENAALHYARAEGLAGES